MTMATLSNVQQMMEFEELETRYIVSAVLYNIPAIVIAVVNGVLIWQLKCLLKTDQFSSSATNEIRRVLFQVRLTNLIAIIFVGSQVSFALWIGLHIVSSFPFVFYIFKGMSSTFRNDFSFIRKTIFRLYKKTFFVYTKNHFSLRKTVFRINKKSLRKSR